MTPARTVNTSMDVGIAVVLAVIVANCFRISVGVDLSDESYYIAFLDGWLKTGVSSSPFLSIHQTAEILIYPLVLAFRALTAGTTGIVLFVRLVFMISNLATGFCIFQLVRRYSHHSNIFAALIAAAMSIAFIPFSLPSFSYNTAGMLAMNVALACIGIHQIAETDINSRRSDARNSNWIWASAAAWTLAVVAYPTLIAIELLTFICIFLAASGPSKGTIYRYIAACVSLQAIAALALLGIFGLEHLREMFTFSNASLNVSSGLFVKLRHLPDPLIAKPWFAWSCLASLALGLARPLRLELRLVALTFVILLQFLSLPTLFTSGHDTTFLLSIFAAGRWVSRLRTAQPMVSPMFLVPISLAAGIVTASTATNGLYNFCVGGFLAGLLGVCLPENRATGPRGEIALIAITFAVVVSNFNFVYGESINPLTTASRRIRSGAFAGLLTTKPHAQSVEQTTALFTSLQGGGKTFLVIGRLSGIYLLSMMQAQTMSTWDFGQQLGSTPAMDQMQEVFFERHSPDVVVEVSDPWTRAPSNSSKKLISRYPQCAQVQTPAWDLKIFTNPENCDRKSSESTQS